MKPRAGCLLVSVLLVVALGVAGILLWQANREDHPVIPEAERCVATANGQSVAVDLEQAHFAGIIAGLSVKRGLPPRAASIALATAYQESGIRNVDYGDRDSIGLFQQRPSQGWGTKKQIMDPYYSTGKFYDALVKVADWKTGDINDVAQKVQRSGYPEAYRDHERDGRILASVLTGQSPGGLTCLERADTTGDAAALTKSLTSALGVSTLSVNGARVTVQAASRAGAWAVAHHVLGNSGRFGVAQVTVGDQAWHHDPNTLPAWGPADPAAGPNQVVIELR